MISQPLKRKLLPHLAPVHLPPSSTTAPTVSSSSSKAALETSFATRAARDFSSFLTVAVGPLALRGHIYTLDMSYVLTARAQCISHGNDGCSSKCTLCFWDGKLPKHTRHHMTQLPYHLSVQHIVQAASQLF